MDPNIIQQIQTLGGSYAEPQDQTLLAQLKAIAFPHSLQYLEDLEDHVEYHFDKREDQFKANLEQALNQLELDFFPESEPGPSGYLWVHRPFTPLTEGTEDYKEWAWTRDEFNFSEVRKVVGEGALEFVQIGYSYGYPDSYFICLQDPNPENPTVFGTDHEVFFDEVSNHGSLLDYLNGFCTRKQFKEIAQSILNEAGLG